jgi:hypothetical protein
MDKTMLLAWLGAWFFAIVIALIVAYWESITDWLHKIRKRR